MGRAGGVELVGPEPGEAVRDAEPRLTVAAVASRLGVAPSTLRTWDRRYGLGPSDHTSGRHRRYGAEDIARLEIMQRALLRGASPAEAARFALTTPPPHAARSAGTDGAAQPVDSQLHAGTGLPFAEPVLLAGADPQPGERAHAGGRGLKLPGGSRRARGLGRAVLALDSPAAHQLLSDSITEDGVAATWNTVVRPVLAALTERWENSGVGVEANHLLRECAITAFGRMVPPVLSARNPRPALLTCVPEEQHSLPLYALSAVLAERAIGFRMFGSALPTEALVAAIKRTGPSAVLLWAQLPRNAGTHLFQELPRTRQRARVLVAGPGWHPVDLPAQVELVDSLTAAADRIEEIVCGRRTSTDGKP